VVEPKPYQDFFVALEKAMFLTAHQVEWFLIDKTKEKINSL
jgi:hypothetical protein